MISLADLTKFMKTSFKHGTLIIALFIPIVLLLEQVDFISYNFMIFVNQTIIAIELVLAFFRIFFNEYLKSLSQFKAAKASINAGNFDKVKEIAKDNISEALDLGKETVKEIITTVKNKKAESKAVAEAVEAAVDSVIPLDIPKESTPETTPETEIRFP